MITIPAVLENIIIFVIEEWKTITYLLGFNSSSVLFSKAELRDGHVVQDDVEVLGSLSQLSPDQHTYLLTLCNQLGGIEFSNNRL